VREAVHTNRAPSTILPSGWWGVSAVNTEGTEMTVAEGNAGWQCVLDISVFCHARVMSS
jgi:hypothetical protein